MAMWNISIDRLTHFIKLARLSGFDACFCCPDRSACSPALRFFARFLLVALAVGLRASGATGFLTLAGILALSRTACPGGPRAILVSRLHLSQRSSLYDSVVTDGLLLGTLNPRRELIAKALVGFCKDLPGSCLIVFQLIGGIWILPQPPQARCCWISVCEALCSYRSWFRWLMRWAEVPGAVRRRRCAALVRYSAVPGMSSMAIVAMCEAGMPPGRQG